MWTRASIVTISSVPAAAIGFAAFASSMVGCGQVSEVSAPAAADGGQQPIDVDANPGSAVPVAVAGTGDDASRRADASADAGGTASADVNRSEADAQTESSVAAPASADGAASNDAQMTLGLCTGPTGAKASDAQAAYAKWKADLVTSTGARGFRRVLRPNSPNAINTSNSEGTGYGMLLSVAMNDEALFDDLWQYEQLFLDGNGLMNWEIDPTGTGPTAEGTGGATDGDEDMAFALLWADHRWGGKGSLASTYHALALTQIDLVWQHEVDQSRGAALAPGDQFPSGAGVLNISYFAPAYYRAFGQANGKQTDWDKVVESSYTIIAASLNAANKNATNGLVPAWATPAGAPQTANATMPTNYQLDSCRTPFRLGQDYCWYGEARAKSYLAKISAFYQQIGASHIVNGYNLDGTANPTNPTVNQSAAFVGPAGVGAMSDPAFAMLRDQAYAGVATLGELDGSTYYTESWTALSLVMMNGEFWDPAKP
jgi:endo-1,4-beta-D-glucanase Y